MKNRRDCLAALAAGALATALPVGAQPSPFRIAWTSPTKAADGSPFLDELRRGLRELGYVEGRNLVIEPYWGEDSADRIQKMVVEAVASNPHVIVAQGATAPPMRRATTAIPVVFGYSGDPVEAGLVQSLSRPAATSQGSASLRWTSLPSASSW
jgi:putative ABC transport system substrate-binding protein